MVGRTNEQSTVVALAMSFDGPQRRILAALQPRNASRGDGRRRKRHETRGSSLLTDAAVRFSDETQVRLGRARRSLRPARPSLA